MLKTYFCFFTFLLLASCTQNENPATEDHVSAMPSETAAQDVSTKPSNPQLIKTADCRFQTEDVSLVTSSIESISTGYGAYIADSKLSMSYGTIEQSLTIRVPAEKFEELLREIDGLSTRTDYRNVSASDVSKEFVDLESRLKTKREVHARYTAILRDKTGTIEDVLAAERQIGQIQEEIEATISRLNYLKEKVSYSTIMVRYYQLVEHQPLAQEENFFTEINDAFLSGLAGAKTSVIAILHIWPLILLSIPLIVIFRKRWQKENAGLE
jgi:molybdopterin converting factor small subunit